jgi:hypothetical protein
MPTTTVRPPTGVVDVVGVAEPLFSEPERVALAGFLAGFSGLTRDAYALDLRQYTSWCQTGGLRLFTARRAGIELFGRDLKPAAGPGPPSRVGSAPSQGSIDTP